MCGISGFLDFNKNLGSDLDQRKALLQKMCVAMAHRGPNGSGYFNEGPLGLGHRRLAVLDLSENSAQPMQSADGEYALVYNGEIYNHLELRRDLIAQGCRFKSSGDSEVLLWGLIKHGKKFLEKINGDFAFGFWNKKTETLLLARDRLGIKPLYWARMNSVFYFASEMRPLLAAGASRAISKAALSNYFRLRYCPGPQSIFENIKKIQPGQWLEVSADHENSGSFWDLKSIGSSNTQNPEDKVYELLVDAVKIRGQADVPVATTLSGGIDSSVICALLKKSSEHQISSYTYGIGGNTDESQAAAQFAKSNNVDFHLVPHSPDCFSDFKNAVESVEEPIGDSILLASLKLLQEISKKFRVSLVGEGADEIFGGYVHHSVFSAGIQFRNLFPAQAGSWIQKIPLGFFQKIFPHPGKLDTRSIQRLSNHLARNLDHDFSSAYLDLAQLFNEQEINDLLQPEWQNSTPRHLESMFADFIKDCADSEPMNKLYKLDLRYWNTDYSLLRVDKLAMSQGLEVRVPYLDHRLVELCLGLPEKSKNGLFERKTLLRKALKNRNLIPESVRKAKKIPFQLPIMESFDKTFFVHVQETLAPKQIEKFGILNPRVVLEISQRPIDNIENQKKLMALYLFQLWCESFLN